MDNRFERLADSLRKLPGVSKVESEVLPSGVTFVTVWFDGRCLALQYDPKQGSIVYDVEEQVWDVGPAEYFNELAPAAARLIDLVRDASAVPRVAAG